MKKRSNAIDSDLKEEAVCSFVDGNTAENVMKPCKQLYQDMINSDGGIQYIHHVITNR